MSDRSARQQPGSRRDFLAAGAASVALATTASARAAAFGQFSIVEPPTSSIRQPGLASRERAGRQVQK